MTSYGAMTPVDNPLAYETERRMAERAAAAEEAKLSRLEELAMTGGGNPDGSFTGMGNQKRIRRGAQAALGERMGMQRARMTDATQRSTQQAQNDVTMRGQDLQGQIAAAKADAEAATSAQTRDIALQKLDMLKKFQAATLAQNASEFALKRENQDLRAAQIAGYYDLTDESMPDNTPQQRMATAISMADSRIDPETGRELRGM